MAGTSVGRQLGAGNWGLAFLKSLMFDVDYGEGEGHLASGRQPIRGRFNLRPRRNSGFIKQLDDLGSGRSRFAPLLRDAAAVSIHVCLALPAEGEELFEAAADWLEVYAGRPAVSAEMSAAVLSVARALNDVAGTGTGEFMLRLAHTETSGSVVLAGFQSKDQSPPQQMQHVATFAREFTAHIAGASVESVQRHGRPLVHVRLPELDGFPARVSDIWFAQRDGCFWIAAGGENAHEIIRIAADRCEKGGRAVRTRLATAKLDLEHWMSWPQKDPTGLAALPSWIESSEASWLVSAFSPSGRNQESIPTPLLDKVMGLRGSKQAWLTLDVSKAGFAAEAELGRPLADWFFARQMDTQEQMMEQRKKQSEEQAEALRKAKEAAATAPASVPTE